MLFILANNNITLKIAYILIYIYDISTKKNIAHEIKRKYFQINNEVTKLQK